MIWFWCKETRKNKNISLFSLHHIIQKTLILIDRPVALILLSTLLSSSRFALLSQRNQRHWSDMRLTYIQNCPVSHTHIRYWCNIINTENSYHFKTRKTGCSDVILFHLKHQLCLRSYIIKIIIKKYIIIVDIHIVKSNCGWICWEIFILGSHLIPVFIVV